MICEHIYEKLDLEKLVWMIMKAFIFSPTPWNVCPVVFQAVRKPCFPRPIPKGQKSQISRRRRRAPSFKYPFIPWKAPLAHPDSRHKIQIHVASWHLQKASGLFLSPVLAWQTLVGCASVLNVLTFVRFWPRNVSIRTTGAWPWLILDKDDK